MKTLSRTARINALLVTIKSISGSLTRSHLEVRHCSRCRLPLIDPSSWERGIGPICAKKDTALFAKTIPANFAMVTMSAMSVTTTFLPETTRGVWTSLLDLIIDHSERAANAKENAGGGFCLTGEDCRLVAKVIDWMLSFKMDSQSKGLLIQVVKFLGFVGLAGVLSGKASTGEAKIGFENGKLTLLGSSNKEAFRVFRTVPGVTLPKYRGDKTPYTVPATQHEKFFEIAMEFYPCFEEDVEALREKCLAWIAANPVQKVEVRSTKPVAKIVERPGDFTLNFQWIRGVSERIVAELKTTVPYRDRKYDPATYTWSVKCAHRAKVQSLLEGVYAVEQTQGAPSPAATRYGSSYGYRRTYRR